MSIIIQHECSVTCELCSKKFTVTITCHFDGDYCENCVKTVLPGIDAMYEKMRDMKVRFTWYENTFKLNPLEKMVYKKYMDDVRIEKAYRKERERVYRILNN